MLERARYVKFDRRAVIVDLFIIIVTLQLILLNIGMFRNKFPDLLTYKVDVRFAKHPQITSTVALASADVGDKFSCLS